MCTDIHYCHGLQSGLPGTGNMKGAAAKRKARDCNGGSVCALNLKGRLGFSDLKSVYSRAWGDGRSRVTGGRLNRQSSCILRTLIQQVTATAPFLWLIRATCTLLKIHRILNRKTSIHEGDEGGAAAGAENQSQHPTQHLVLWDRTPPALQSVG
jgi:hypothetical protein